MGKPLTQMVPDFREALEEGVQDAAEQVVYDLKRAGPYWSGQFESLWQVNAGRKAIKPRFPTLGPTPTKARSREITEVDVPASPNLGGYTIGNQALYRAYAMDLLPSNYGRQQGNAPNKTAPRFWFDTYFNSQMPRAVNTQIANVFRRYK